MEFYETGAGIWDSVFAVPTDIVDKYLKIAGSAQLKVLLWLLRNSSRRQNISAQDIASSLNMNPIDVKDSMEFWFDVGLIKKSISNSKNKSSVTQTVITEDIENKFEKSSIKTQTSDLKDNETENAISIKKVKVQPTRTEIAQRKEFDNHFSDLLNLAEKLFARPLTHNDMSILLLMHDHDGLPYEVINMILQFASDQNRLRTRYIENLGHQWGNEGIDSIEKAEEKIANISNSYKAWSVVCSVFELSNNGTATERQLELANCWINKWGYDENMLRLAYETCLNTKCEFNLNYINGIIRKWYKNDILTEKDLADSRKSSEEIYDKNDNKSKKVSTDRDTSYDINAFEEFDIFD